MRASSQRWKWAYINRAETERKAVEEIEADEWRQTEMGIMLKKEMEVELQTEVNTM